MCWKCTMRSGSNVRNLSSISCYDFKHENLLLVLINVCSCFITTYLLRPFCRLFLILAYFNSFLLISTHFYLFQLIFTYFFQLIFTYFNSFLPIFLLFWTYFSTYLYLFFYISLLIFLLIFLFSSTYFSSYFYLLLLIFLLIFPYIYLYFFTYYFLFLIISIIQFISPMDSRAYILDLCIQVILIFKISSS